MPQTHRRLLYDLTPYVRAPMSSVGLCSLYMLEAMLRLSDFKAHWEVDFVSRVHPKGVQLLGRPVRKVGLSDRFSNSAVYYSGDSLFPYFFRGNGVVTLHDCWTLRPNDWQSPEFQKMKAPKFLRSLKKARHIVTSTEHVRRQYIKMHPEMQDRVSTVSLAPVLPFLNEAENFKASIQKDAPVARLLSELKSKGRSFVLSVGNFENRKNYSPLFQAMKKLPELDLVVVGSRGHGAEKVEAELRSLQAERTGVHWMQGLSQKALAQLYKEAFCLVQPSWDEGFGLPAAEGLHFEKALLLSDIPPHHETAGDAALYFDPSDGEAMSLLGHLKALSENSEVLSQLERKSRERSGLLSWERTAQGYLRIFSS